MELKLGHKTILRRLEHSASSLKDFTHATQAVGNQGYHYERYLSDLENYGYVVLIGDYYHITGFGVAKLEEHKRPRPVATKISKGTRLTGPYRDWETDRKSTRLNSSH